MLLPLLRELEHQIISGNYGKQVEILIDIDGGNKSTGAKRNSLLQRATGKYTAFIDDDDSVTPEYLPLILEAINQDADVYPVNGFMTVDGYNRTSWRMSKELPYETIKENGKTVFLRYPNHLAVIRASIAKQFVFPDINNGEDYDWATQIHNSGLLKTEVIIPNEIYHYQYKTHK
jgi:glycosyltransferase involved in cell wall biosynthesis